MIIVGFDPSLSNWGIALCSYSPLLVKKVDIIRTKPVKGISKNVDDLRRCREIYRGIQKYVELADRIYVEIPHGSQSSRAMASYGVCIGLLASIAKPLIKVSAYDVKHVVGEIKTSKEEIIEYVEKRFPNVLDKRKTIAEHQADALVSILAGLKKEEL